MKRTTTYITDLFKAGEKNIEVNYVTSHDFCNNDFTEVKFGEYSKKVRGKDFNELTAEIVKAVDKLKSKYPQIHTNKRNVEIHRFYTGFNSVEHVNTIVSICMEGQEIIKLHQKKCESGKGIKLEEALKQFPCNEFFWRMGFGFRGAGEGRYNSLEELLERKQKSGAVMADWEIIDDELHMNGYSANDMW